MFESLEKTERKSRAAKTAARNSQAHAPGRICGRPAALLELVGLVLENVSSRVMVIRHAGSSDGDTLARIVLERWPVLHNAPEGAGGAGGAGGTMMITLRERSSAAIGASKASAASPCSGNPRGGGHALWPIGRRARDAGRRVDLGLVERFVRQQLLHDRVELPPVLDEQPLGLFLALLVDAAHFFVHRVQHGVGRPRHSRIALGGQHRDHANAL